MKLDFDSPELWSLIGRYVSSTEASSLQTHRKAVGKVETDSRFVHLQKMSTTEVAKSGSGFEQERLLGHSVGWTI